MKIRKITQKETNDIKKIIKSRYDIARQANDLLLVRLGEAYKNYVRDFKWSFTSPFTFKPMSEFALRRKIVGVNTTYTFTRSVILKFMEADPFELIHTLGYDSSYQFESKADRDLFDLVRYCNRNVFFADAEDIEFIEILAEYAEEPYNFTYEDLTKVTKFKRQNNYLERTFKEIQDAIQTGQ